MRIANLTILSLLVLSCKSTSTRTNAGKSIDQVDLKNVKCLNYIEIESIPTFFFCIKKENAFSEAYLIDTLFNSYKVSKIYYDWNLKNSVNDKHYYEFSKHYNEDVNLNRFTDKQNKYIFYRQDNGKYSLAYSELEFTTSIVNQKKDKDDETELFKIKTDTALIDIAISKETFAKIFNQDVKRLCDTVKIFNDTDESWYLFKKNKLNRIIIEKYTH